MYFPDQILVGHPDETDVDPAAPAEIAEKPVRWITHKSKLREHLRHLYPYGTGIGRVGENGEQRLRFGNVQVRTFAPRIV